MQQTSITNPATQPILIALYKHQHPFKNIPHERMEAMVKQAWFQGAELVVVDSNGFNFENQTIQGMVRNAGRWELVERAFPKVLITDNPTPSRTRSEIEKHIRASFVPSAYLIHEKQYITERILSPTPLKKYVIETSDSQNPQEIIACIHRWKNVYFKPSNGFRGIGIFNIILTGDEYLIKNNDKTWQLRHDDFLKFLEEKLVRKYLTQPNIQSITKNGCVFDFRLHVQCNRQGVFQITHRYARVSTPHKILSNLSQGATAVDVDYFLHANFDAATASALSEELSSAALAITHTINRFYKFPIDELGIDLGIDHRGHIQFFEANSCPQSRNHEEKRAVNTIGYALYLHHQ
jgi:hypothetical protein